MKILIILPNWIGDVVMSLPVLENARKIFKNNDIKILIKKDIFSLIEENCKLWNISPIFYFKKDFKEFFQLIKIIKSEKFDIVFILPRSYRMFLIALFSSISKKFGYGDFIKNIFFKKSLKRNKKALTKHRVFYYLDILNLYSKIDYNIFPKLYISEKLKNFAINFIKENNLEKKLIIGINPGATYGMAKCWPIERYNKLIKKISENYENVFFLIFGGKDNIEYNKKITSKNLINLTGKLSLNKSAALISKCKIFITNDTGPMHIADAIGVEIVAIFGPTDPKETPPFRKRKYIIYKGLECSPCKERICPLNHQKCMLQISVDNVFEKIKEVMEEVYAKV